MRIFTTLVFDQTVRGSAEVVSSAEFDELLGKAYDLYYEVEVEESSGTTQTITVKHKMGNSGKGFLNHVTVVNGASIASPPYRGGGAVSGPLGRLGQVGVTLGHADAVARVRVWVTGWSR